MTDGVSLVDQLALSEVRVRRALAVNRIETLQPLFDELHTVFKNLLKSIPGDPISFESDPKLILGRLETLLNLCEQAIEESLSQAVIDFYRSKDVQRILGYLATMPVSNMEVDALCLMFGRTPEEIHKTLAEMEDHDMVIVTEEGQRSNHTVSLGSKGRAYLKAMQGGN